MKMRARKNQLDNVRAAFLAMARKKLTNLATIAPKTAFGLAKMTGVIIEPLPPAAEEYHIGRKSNPPKVDIDEVVEVVRKKDQFSLGLFARTTAEAMIEKAKQQKKAALMIV